MLSKCNALLCGLSYVSYVARIMKQNQNEQYEELIILNKGKSQVGISLWEAEAQQRNQKEIT